MQVTVDPELAEAMAAIDPHPKSKSRLIRDLAVRGAAATEEDKEKREKAKEFFLKVARKEIDIDMTGAIEALEEREAEIQ
ncbi:MAG: hypothetical protein WD404_07590 [Solirubrobacterales bacterium]